MLSVCCWYNQYINHKDTHYTRTCSSCILTIPYTCINTNLCLLNLFGSSVCLASPECFNLLYKCRLYFGFIIIHSCIERTCQKWKIMSQQNANQKDILNILKTEIQYGKNWRNLRSYQNWLVLFHQNIEVWKNGPRGPEVLWNYLQKVMRYNGE